MRTKILSILFMLLLGSCEADCQVPSIGGMKPHPYIAETPGEVVYEIVIQDAVYDNVSLNFTSHQTLGRDFVFKPDGTEVFIVGTGTVKRVSRYSLSTAWDLSSYTWISDFTVSWTSYGYGIEFNPDGTKMYITCGYGCSVDITQYSLSPAWDITTSTVEYSYSTASLTYTYDIDFNDDGTTAYFLDNSDLKKADLVTPYDLSTAGSVTTEFDITPGSNIQSHQFVNNGNHYFYSAYTNSLVYHSTFTTAYDFSSVTSQEVYDYTFCANSNSMYISVEAEKMYIMSFYNDLIYQYSITVNPL